MPLFISLLASVALNAPQPVVAKHGIVASSSSIASQVGVDIMKEGGNAIDAACAVGFALAVTHPAAGNLGGGGFMLIRLANGLAVTVDYREIAPLAARSTMYQDEQGNVVPGLSLVGYKASGVPGTVAGLALAHAHFGHLPWKAVLEPARVLAEKGFPVSKSLAIELRAASNLPQFPESKRIFLKGGAYYKAGEIFRQPDLANTIARLQASPSDFYTGKTARLIAKAMAGKGLITLADLKSYQPVERQPLEGSYRGYTVLSMPPPSSGGIALIEMLNMLEHYDLAASGAGTAKTDHLLVEAMRHAFADRAEFLGDPAFTKVPVKGLTSKKYAETLLATLDDSKATPSSEVGHGAPPVTESHQTTHFSVVDSQGNAVSNTYTLNFGFGSGVTVPGAGFLMNDEMDDFTSKVGVPNGFGLIQGTANDIQPKKRPLSSMTPTIVTRNGKLYMVIGSPGGPTIITTVLQVISNVIDHHMNIAQAIAAARIHHQWLPDRIDNETDALSEAVYESLIGMGYTITHGPKPEHAYWGDAEGILVDSARKALTGASDPRTRDAAAVGY
ncbi:MAG TPA: gamma-glutamyltransferase [Fimbriimonas sp.]|nr:gamma-glutamyltransferase [Fimbriimonas sp.]